jgi:Flp pilus assembly CpaE family ATPase
MDKMNDLHQEQQDQAMNVTYMFRATNREARGLSRGDAVAQVPGDLPSVETEPPVTFSAPEPLRAAPTQMPPTLVVPSSVAAAAAPARPRTPTLVLGNPVAVEPAHMAAARAVHDTMLPAPALPAKYVATEGRIILVAKARGGIGATTLAVNLALEMQVQAARRGDGHGGRVALVDLDVQLGNAGSFLDLADRGGMLALARLGPEPDAQAMRHAMMRHPTGLSVLAAPATAIPFEAFDIRRIASMLDALATEHDAVIVDLPPALIDWLEPLLARAERVLMVTDLAVPSVVRARRIISLLTQDHPKLPVEIVVAHEKKPFRMGPTHRDAETALGRPLRHWLPEETKLARQALDRGEPLVQLAPRCGWSRAVKAMATELLTATKSGAKVAAKGDR